MSCSGGTLGLAFPGDSGFLPSSASSGPVLAPLAS
jgi:hypothetical protein